MPLTVEQFTQRLTSSGVMSEEQLREAFASLATDSAAHADGEQLARELIQQKRLTKFQAEQLYAGKEKSLTLGNYVILDKLGQGGMGLVLKAWHRRMERTVALKVIAPKVVQDKTALKRFQREVVAAAKLSHPNIVAAYDADEAKGTHFLVMEYVEGADLASHVKRNGPLPVELAVNCIVQAARGLAFAHAQGVIHRDIKPHNLLLDPKGVLKILDMGLARLEGSVGGSAAHADLTNSGAMMGTVDYMSPEQAMDAKYADARSDIYSLGCTLFFVLTGRATFVADTMMKRLTAHQNAPLPSLVAEAASVRTNVSSSDAGSVGHALDAVFRRMIAKRPEDRFQSMAEVIAALEQCQTGTSATVDTTSSSESSGQALQSFLKEITGEGSTTTRPGDANSLRTAVLPNVDDESQQATLVESQAADHSSAETQITHTPSAAKQTSRARSQTSSRRIWLAATVAGVLLLSFLVFVVKSNRGTLRISLNDPELVVTISGTDHVVKDEGEEDVSVKPGEYTLHVRRGTSEFDSDPIEVKKGETIPVKVELVGRRVRVMQGNTLLGHKELPKSKTDTAVTDRRLPPQNADRRAAEWVLSIGGTITIKENDQERQITAVGELPRGTFELTAVLLGFNPQVSDAGLALFKDCKNLANLTLYGTPVTDAGLVHFKNCKNLTDLILFGTQVSDAGLAYFKDCKNLTRLDLHGTQVSDAGLAHFRDCKNLTLLHLNRNQVSDAGLVHFQDCKNLTDLGLGMTRVSDAGLALFKDCKNLTVLSLHYTAVTDAGLVHFKDCKSFTNLELGQTKVSDVGLAFFQDCKDLLILNLSNTQVSDSGLAYFKDCKNLERLVLTATQVSDVGLAYFADCPKLVSLLIKDTKVTEAGVTKLSAALPGCKIEWDGTFVTLRSGAAAARHATLEEALEASQPQDVIEVHGNGPFPIGGPKNVLFQQKEFTLKAAAGFRPLFVSAPDAVHNAFNQFGLFYFIGGTARFEDIDFVSAGPGLFGFKNLRDVEFLRCRCASTSQSPGVLMGFQCGGIELRLKLSDCVLASPIDWATLGFGGTSARVEITNTLLFGHNTPLVPGASENSIRMTRCTIPGIATTWANQSNDLERDARGSVELSRCLVLGPALYLNDPGRLTKDIRWQGKENVYGSLNGLSGIAWLGQVTQTFDEWVNSPAKPETGSKLVPTKAKPLEEFLDPDPAVMFRKLKTYLEELRALHPDVGADPAVADPGVARLATAPPIVTLNDPAAVVNLKRKMPEQRRG